MKKQPTLNPRPKKIRWQELTDFQKAKLLLNSPRLFDQESFINEFGSYEFASPIDNNTTKPFAYDEPLPVIKR